MDVNIERINKVTVNLDAEGHPKGLYVLFATEMWERFSFYSMLALFTLYLRDPAEGFGWSAEQATSLYSSYLLFVYASPLIGGYLADSVLGYRRSVMIGGVFFIFGHALLSIPTTWAVYAALTCLVIGNGFFKPNVSTLVGRLYPEKSSLKESAFLIFYLGINIGGFVAPLVMEFVKSSFGFHPAFAVAAFGMIVSVTILWKFKNSVERPDQFILHTGEQDVDSVTTDNLPPAPRQQSINQPEARVSAFPGIDSVPEWKRISALILVFAIIIVFFMVFYQNGSTLTFWADDNTDWAVSGVISNSINSFFILTLTFPLIWFWNWLGKHGREPSTPTKMALGMMLTALSFFVFYWGAIIGEKRSVLPETYSAASFRINDRVLEKMQAEEGASWEMLDKIRNAKDRRDKYIIYDVKFAPLENPDTGQSVSGEKQLTEALDKVIPEQAAQYREALLRNSYLFRVSPLWLILAYAIISLGELMLSPMGLSLVSRVAPVRLRGLMTGAWFAATSIGGKLSFIGIYWEVWQQSNFFLVLGLMALAMAVLLGILVKPLKRVMPGV